jgi:hypothetical protein
MIAFLGTAIEEGVKTAPDIIRASSGSPLGIFALMIICLSLLALAFFRRANQYVQLAIFVEAGQKSKSQRLGETIF